MSRTTEEIMNDVLDGKQPEYNEVYYALIALYDQWAVLNGVVIAYDDEFIQFCLNNGRFVMDSTPFDYAKKRGIDPRDPKYQKRRMDARKAVDKLIEAMDRHTVPPL